MLRLFAWIWVLPTWLVVVPACQSGLADRGAPALAENPEALIEHLRQIEKSKDYGAALPSIPVAEREEAIFITWFGAAYDAIGDNRERSAAYQAILGRHPVDEAYLSADMRGRDKLRAVAAEALAEVDQAEFFADLIAFKTRYGRFKYAFGFLDELTAMRVDGESATAQIGLTEFTFVRQNGLWYWRYLPAEL